MKKIITPAERLQLLGLLTLGIQYHQKLCLVEDGMKNILEHDDAYVDQLSDALYDEDIDIDKILGYMEIVVEESK